MAANSFCAADKETHESLCLLDALESILCRAEASIPFAWFSKPDDIESVPNLITTTHYERFEILRTTCALWISLYHAHHPGLKFEPETHQVVIESRFEGPTPIQRLFLHKSELESETKTPDSSSPPHYLAFFACSMGPNPPVTGGPIDKAVMYSTMRLIEYGWDMTWTVLRVRLARSVARALATLNEEKCLPSMQKPRQIDHKFFDTVYIWTMNRDTMRTWALVEYVSRLTSDSVELRGVFGLWALMFEQAFAVYSLVDILERATGAFREPLVAVAIVRLYSIAQKYHPQLLEMATYLATTGVPGSAPVPTARAIEEMSAWLNFAASANAWLAQHRLSESTPCKGCAAAMSFALAAETLDKSIRTTMDVGCWAVKSTPRDQVLRECWTGRAMSAINGLIAAASGIVADTSVIPVFLRTRVGLDSPKDFMRACVRKAVGGQLNKDHFVKLRLVSN